MHGSRQLHAPAALLTTERDRVTHQMRDCVGSRAGLDRPMMAMRKIPDSAVI
jgi:hypothetical protein